MRRIDIFLIGVGTATMACGGSAFAPSTGADADVVDQSSTQPDDVTSPDMNLPDASADGALPPDPARIDATAADAPHDAGSTYRSLILGDAPIAYWRMGIASGSIVPDESGHKNDLLLQGTGHVFAAPSAIKGDLDKSIGFDGKNSYAIATRPRDFDFPASAPFTIECWARRQAVADGGTADFFQHLLGSATGSPRNRNGFLLYAMPSGPNVSFEYDAPDGGQVGFMGGLPELSIYAHYAAVFDGKNASLYVDASLASSKPVQGAIASRLSELSVGREFSSGRYYFSGSIDEIAIYDKALSAAQVVRHHDVGIGR